MKDQIQPLCALTPAIALAYAYNKGFEPVYMNSLLKTISDYPDLRNIPICTPSVRVFGTTKKGTEVVVFGHVPNYFAIPENLETTIANGLINGAGIYPREEFEKLLKLEDEKNVFVIDYKQLTKHQFNDIPTNEAAEHPQVIASCGGIEEAKKYINQHEIYVGQTINITYKKEIAKELYAMLMFRGLHGKGSLSGGSLTKSGTIIARKK